MKKSVKVKKPLLRKGKGKPRKHIYVLKGSYRLDQDKIKRAISTLENTCIRSDNLHEDALKLNAAISCRADIDFLMKEVAAIRAIVAKLIPSQGLSRLQVVNTRQPQ